MRNSAILSAVACCALVAGCGLGSNTPAPVDPQLATYIQSINSGP